MTQTRVIIHTLYTKCDLDDFRGVNSEHGGTDMTVNVLVTNLGGGGKNERNFDEEWKLELMQQKSPKSTLAASNTEGLKKTKQNKKKSSGQSLL